MNRPESRVGEPGGTDAIIFEIDDKEILLDPGTANIVLYNDPDSARYNHIVLNLDGEEPIRQFVWDHAGLYKWVSAISAIGKERPDDNVRVAYWQSMIKRGIEFDEEDFEECNKVLAAQAERELSIGFEDELSEFLGNA